MENSEPFALYVDDADESYLVWRKQAMDVHLTLGTQRLLDLRKTSAHPSPCQRWFRAYPVSRMTLNLGTVSALGRNAKGWMTHGLWGGAKRDLGEVLRIHEVYAIT